MAEQKREKFTKDPDPAITGREAEIYLNDRKDGFDLRLKDSIDNLIYDRDRARIDLEFAWRIISVLLREVGGSFSIDYKALDMVEAPIVNFGDGVVTYIGQSGKKGG